MLAIVYLALMFWVGDVICRRFYRFVSVPHRLAAAFLVGMLASSWFTYLTALVFASTTRPLFWSDLLFFGVTLCTFAWMVWKQKKTGTSATGDFLGLIVAHLRANETLIVAAKENDDRPIPNKLTARADEVSASPVNVAAAAAPSQKETQSPFATAGHLRSTDSRKLDWVLIGAYSILAAWLMFATFNSSGGKLHTSMLVWMDFGPNVSLLQSFADGKNFPTTHPLFAGENIRYHFLFWFQAANLKFLGLDPAWSVNLLSIFSIVTMLIVTMVLGEMLFGSRAVGYVASALFFFFGSLSYIPFFLKQESLGAALRSITNLQQFLPSAWPQIRGETWGNYSQAIFINQRHLAGGIALLLLVLTFLVLRYRDVPANKDKQGDPNQITIGADPAGPERTEVDMASSRSRPFWSDAPGFIFSGALLGLLPMWNGAAFLAAFPLLLILFILLPLRKQMLALAATTAILAMPQLVYLTVGAYRDYPIIHWGYSLSQPGCQLNCFDNPSVWFVTKYLGFLAGFKWLLVAVALFVSTRLQRGFFLASLSLLVMTFFFQLSPDILNNNKPLHVWMIVINLFAGYGLYRLWTANLGRLAGRIVATVVAAAIIPGGIIDLLPIHNTRAAEADLKDDPLTNWARTNTKGDAVFLSDQWIWHPILLAGRKTFLGGPFFGWSAGYNLAKRDLIRKQMFESNNPAEVFRMLKENGIDYVAYDDAVRHADFLKKPNEQLYSKNFEKAWVDETGRYGRLVIYKVPDVAPTGAIAAPEPVATESTPSGSPGPPVSMFAGGPGAGRGRFSNPQGLAIDRVGNILVTDMSNQRIQKFAPNGDFINSFGQKGVAEGEFGDPFGIVVDRDDNIYVVEAGNGRIQKFKSDGSVVELWRRTVDELDMHGPRKAAIGPDDALYVVDMGHARIIKFNLDGRQIGHWGVSGDADGQFKDMTSVAVDPKENRVYVADPGNKRIQIFDPNGKFLGKWPVDEWGTFFGFEDLAIDAQARRLYASSATMDNILVFDLNTGKRLAPVQPKPPDKLESPTAIAVGKGKLYVLNNRTARVSMIDLPGQMEQKKTDTERRRQRHQ